MPNPEFIQPEIPATGLDSGASAPNAGVEAQIQTGDVSSAHQFFSTSGASNHLPGLTLGDGGSAASMGNAALGQTGLGNATIGQAFAGPAAVGNAAIGQTAAIGNAALGQTANAAVGNALIGKAAAIGNAAIGNAAIGALATPGAEPISPLVQLILKMPGLTGVMSSFFEFLNTLFSGQILDALNPANWVDSIAGAVSNIADGGDSLSMGLEFLDGGGDGPLLTFDGESFHSLGMGSGDPIRFHSEAGRAADAANVGSPVDNVGLEQAIFERTSNFQYHDYTQNVHMPWRTDQQLALGPGGEAYKPVMGGVYPTGSQGVTPTTTPPLTHHSAAPAAHHAPVRSGGDQGFVQAAKHFKTTDITSDQSQLATATEAPADYTVQSGDNLWDIAHQKLGDGSRWGDIYKLNSEVIGQNPDLIHPGTSLRMPAGTESIASADKYVVQPGDNLWDISKSHLGGGQHWGQIYHANEGVIGGNPRLIMPGQELHLGGADTHIASTAGHHHIASASDGVHHHAGAGAHHGSSHHHVAHSTPAHGQAHVAHHAPAHAQHVAMQPGAESTHVGGHAQTTTISAQGIFKEQTPVMAPVEGTPAASGPAAGTSTPATSYSTPSTGSEPS